MLSTVARAAQALAIWRYVESSSARDDASSAELKAGFEQHLVPLPQSLADLHAPLVFPADLDRRLDGTRRPRTQDVPARRPRPRRPTDSKNV